MSQIQQTGGCVCGRVRYACSAAPLRVTVCHCQWCQRRTGSAFGIQVVYAREQVQFTHAEPARYRHISDESGRWLDQEFCSTCGSNIGLTLEAAPEIQAISAGTFDDPSFVDATQLDFRHVFVRSARSWSNIPADLEQYELHFRSD